MTDHSLTMERDFAVDPDLMWELWTDGSHIAQWMMPSLERYKGATCIAEARPGGQFRLVIPGVDAGEWIVAGEFRVLEPKTRVSFTWGWEGTGQLDSVVDVTIAPTDAGCRITLVHSKLWDEESLASHKDGWEGCLATLTTVYASA